VIHTSGEAENGSLNLLLLLFASLLPFPTRLVAESLEDVSGERVFVTMYGLTLLAIRILLFAVDTYAHKEQLYLQHDNEKKDEVRQTILPIVAAYVVAIRAGLVLPRLAIAPLLPPCHLPPSRSRSWRASCSTAPDARLAALPHGATTAASNSAWQYVEVRTRAWSREES
jgi:hypothetical protein